MDSFFDKRLITTKDASELSGYTSDYLSRLVRLGKIEGQRIGHSWLIERESLEVFLKNQKTQKSEYAHSLSLAREEEYRAHRSLLRRKAKLSKPPVPLQKGIRESSVFSQVFALTAALLVVASGAFAAQAVALPRLGEQVAELAHQVAFGFRATFGGIPYGIAERIDAADASMRTTNARVAADTALGSARDASPILSGSDLSLLQNVFPAGVARPTAIALVPSEPAHVPPLTVADVQSSALGAYAFLTSPARMEDALAGAYAALGTHAYDAITASFAAYRSLIVSSGPGALAFGAFARDMLAKAPHAVSAMNLAFGGSVIRATHAAIRADVAVAYGFATAAPASARVTVALVGGIGNTLAGATARTPALATTAFLQATQVPATLAPALAQTVFSGEYVAATRFVAITNTISERYLALVSGTGTLAYTGTAGVLALANLTPPLFAHAPAAVENTYLGLVGNGALAIDSLPTHLARLVSVKHIPVLAAALPALSAGEQVALFTYQTIHGFFTSATGALAGLFGTPNVAVVSNPPSVVLPFATSTTPVSAPQAAAPARTERVAVTSYPTYTTVVQGVSQDFVNQSLASLRTSILATVAGMIQPVAAQGVTNENTIQYVNMIQDLSNLTVHNGNFLGGTFNGGNLTNGISVSAASGSFTNLTGGNTSLATTSISGALTTTGNVTIGGTLTAGSLSVSGISSGGAISAPYFTATSSTATSTFSGSLNVGNGGFLYASSTRNVGIGVLSPAALLALQNSTSTQPIFVASNAAGAEVYRITNAGFVGIGTTSPTYALSVEGSSSLGNNAIAGYFSATSSAATSTFAGSLAVGTSTQFTNGLFAVGTSSPLLYVNSTTGRVGVGTSSPGFALDVNGIVNASSLYVNGAPYIGSQWTTASSSIYYNTGNVGIGSTSPYAKLSLAGAAGSTTPLFAISTSTALFATTTALTIDANGNLSLLNGANLSVGGTLAVAGNTTLASATSTAFAITSLPNALLSTNANGSVVASTSIGVNYLSGVLPIANGGTNSSSQTANGIAYYDGSKLTTGSNLSYNGSQLTLDLVDSWGGLHIQGRGGGEASIALNPDNVSNGGAGQWILETNGNGLNNPHDFCWYSSELARCTFNLVSANGYAGFNTNNPIAPLSVNGGFFATASSTIGGGTQTSGLTIAGGATTTLSQYIGGGLTVAGNTTLANATATNLFSATASSTNLFASNAQLGSLSASSLALTNALPVTSGGTGWSAIQSGTIPYGAGTGALATTTAGVAGNILALLNGIPTWTATTTFSSGLAYANGNVTNAGVLSLAQTYGTPQTGALTFATSTQSFNGLTLGTSLTNTLGAFTFTPSVSGTLNNSGLTNSTIALATGTSGTDVNVSGSPAALGGTLTLNIPTASATNRGALSPTDWSTFNAKQAALTFTYPLVNTANTVSTAFGTTTANSFSQLQQFNGNASSTQLTTTGSTYLATAGGNVGIGTTSPWAQFSINPNGINGPSFAIGSSTATNFVVTNGGNVGIGTINPINKLDVNGNINLPSGGIITTNNNGSIGFGFSGNSSVITSYANTTIQSYNGSSYVPVFTILGTQSAATGNVGIGTTSPFATLSVNGNAFIGGNLTVGGLTATTSISAPYFTATNAAATSTFAGGFQAAGTSGLTVLQNGNVGIGTVAPAQKLDVAGNINTSAGSAYMYNNANVITASTTLNNYFFGGAGNLTMTGNLNIASGLNALKNNTTGYFNLATGFNALAANTTGYYNVANGLQALFNNTTGFDNIATGYVALDSNTTGSHNIASGMYALLSNTTGSDNITSGEHALWNNITGSYNTALGGYALPSNITGNNNSALGYGALSSNTAATSSVAVGYLAAAGTANYSNQGGTYLGYQSGYSAATGSNFNTLLGYQSGYDITTGTNNVILGTEQTTGGGITTGSNNILIGTGVRSGLTPTASNQLNIGNLIFATGLGSEATASTGNVGIGTVTPAQKLDVAGNINTSAGSAYMYNGSNVITASTTLNNYFFGGAGNLTMTGDNNTASGLSALQANTTGYFNTASGVNTLFSNSTGYSNIATGYNALFSNTSGYQNAASGMSALYNNTTGTANTATGYAALYSNNNGINNTADGMNALYANITGSNNTALGVSAGRFISGGVTNNAGSSNSLYLGYGTQALANGDTNEIVIGASVTGNGSNSVTLGNTSITKTILQGNVGIGTTSPYRALSVVGQTLSDSFNATSSVGYQQGGTTVLTASPTLFNTFVGLGVGTSTTGNYNTFVGYQSGQANTSGFRNTATGYQSLYSNTTGLANTANGYYALLANTTGGSNTAVGDYALYANTTGGSNTAVGQSALLANTTGGSNTATGQNSLRFNTTGSDNAALGIYSLYLNTTGYNNSALGYQALRSNTTGYFNTANGSSALYANTTGFQNTANGASALSSNTTGVSNTAAGYGALLSNTTGSNNTADGYGALYSNTTGNFNTANGYQSLYNNTSATSSTALGYNAAYGSTLYSNQGGTYLGYQSGYSAATGSNFNTLLGYQSGYDITTGANNVILGTEQTTGGSITTGSNNILIGTGVRSGLTPTASNQLNIGNLIFATGLGSEAIASTGNVGIGTANPGNKFVVVTTSGGTGISIQTAGANQPTFVLQDTVNNQTGYVRLAGGSSNLMQIGSSASTNLSDVQIGVDITGAGVKPYLDLNATYASLLNGNFGIGTTSPWAQLSINPNGISGPSFAIGSSTATNFVVTNGGNVGIGTTSPAYPLSIYNQGVEAFQFAPAAGTPVAGQYLYFRPGGTGNVTAFGSSAGNFAITAGSGNNAYIGTPGGARTALFNVNNSYGATGNYVTFSGAAAGSTPTIGAAGGSDTNVSLNLTPAGTGNVLVTTGNVGIGTTSPWRTLSVNGTSDLGTNALAGYFTATSTTATSTFAGFIDVNGTGTNATSTFASNLWVKGALKVGIASLYLTETGIHSTDGTINIVTGTTATSSFSTLSAGVLNVSSTTATSTLADGINLSGGCFAVNGTCVGGGSGTAGQFPYYAANGTTLTATSSIFLASSGNVGIGTTSPASKLTVVTSNSNDVNLTLDSTASNSGAYINFNSRLGGVLKQSQIFSDWNGGMVIQPTTGALSVNTISNTYGNNFTVNGNAVIGTGSYLTTAAPSGGLLVGGNVGIGTTTPDQPLVVNGTIKSILNTSAPALNVASLVALGASGITGAENWALRGVYQYPNGVNNNSAGGDLYLIASLNGNTILGTKTDGTALGNVGIGTTSPTANLSVQSNGNSSPAATFMNSGTGSNQFAIYPYQDGNTYLQHNGNVVFSPILGTAPQFVVSSTGNVGVGTTTPGSLLSVQGIANFTTATTTFQSTGGINLASGCFAVNGICVGGGGGGSGTVQSGTTGQFPYYAANGTTLTATSSLFLAPSGNVGIGTTTPSNLLTVAQTSAFPSAGIQLTSSVNDPNIALTNTGTGGRDWRIISSNGLSGVPSTLRIYDNTAGADRLDINSSGNVGIQTAAPSQALTVTGSGQFSGGLGLGGAVPNAVLTGQAMTLNVSGYSNLNGFRVNGADPVNSIYQTNNTNIGFTVNAGNAVNFNCFSAGSGCSGSTASTMMTILTGGNVGIGTTSPWAQLSVNPNGISGPSFAIGSSTATNFVVTNGGNIGIGTTSPVYKLDVAGFVNTDQYSGYKQAGNTVLYASTTNQALAVGASGAAAWMATSSSLAYSVAVGQGALQTSPTSVTAQYNTAVGVNALSANANGYNNTATGYNALTSNTGGYYNTATGYNALTANTTGNYNTAHGMSALRNNTTGIQNTASGYQALYSNSTNSNNVAYGYQALYSNTSDQNMAVGYQALYSNTTGFQNTALGYQALNFNTTGSYNTATGYGALEFTTGNNNTANGYQALVFNTSGSSNTANGWSALQTNTTGSYNTANGTGALLSNTTGNNNSTLGYQSGYNVTGSNNTLLGYQSGYDITSGTNNIVLGTEQTTGGGVTTGSNNILIGTGVRSGLSQAGSNQLNIGNLIFATGLGSEATASTGNVGIGTSTPSSTLTIQAPAGQTALTIASSTGATMLSVNANGSLTAKLNQLTSDYLVDSGSAPINVGDLVAYVNGKAQKARAAIIAGTPVDANAVSSTQESAAALSSTSFVMAYYNGSTGFINAVVGTVSGTAITYGTPVALSASVYSGTNVSVAALSSTAFVISYQAVSTLYAQAVVATVSGTAITYGTPAALNAVSSSYTPVAALSATSFVVAYYNNSTNYANAVVATVSGTTITAGTPQVMSSGTIIAGNFSVAALSSSLFVVAYTVSGPTTYLVAGSVSGTTITAGTPYGAISASSSSVSIATLSSTAFVTGYITGSATINAAVGTVSGTTITFGNAYSFPAPTGTTSASAPSVAAFSSTSFVATYAAANSYYVNAAVGTVSGTTVTWGPNVVLNNVASNMYAPPAVAAALSSSTFVVGYRNPSGYAEAFAAQSVTPSSNIIGMATTAASPGGTVTVASNGIVTGLSGLTTGSTYYDSLALGLSTTTSTYKVGLALSPSSILLNSSNGAGTDQFFGDAVFANNFRITEAPGAPQGLLFENQLGRKVMSIDEAGNLTVSGNLSASGLNLSDVSALGQELLASAATSTATTTQNTFNFASGMAAILNSRFNFNAFNALAASTSTPSVLSLYQGTTTPAITISASGNVGIGTTSPNRALTVSGDVGADKFVVPGASSASFTVGTTTLTAEVPSAVLTADGKGVDLYKLSTFTLATVQSLAVQQAALSAQVSSLAARVAKLENGSISVASGSPVSFSSSTLASALSGFGVLIQKGIAQFGTVVANRFVAATDASGASSAGSGTILAGNTVAQVDNAYAEPTTKVFVTFNAPVTGSWWVSDKAAGSFRVVLSVPQAGDVSFDYFLVQTQGQLATSTPDGTFSQGSSAQSSGTSSGNTTTSISGPVITLLGANPVHLPVGGTFVEPGVTVTDAVDGTDPYITFINGIQQAVSSTTINTASPTTYIITYKATDQAGNSATAIRSVIVGNPDGTVNLGPAPSSGGSTTGTSTTTAPASTATSTASSTAPASTTATSTPAVDTTAPVVTLNGAAAMMLTVGGTFTDPGATATDSVDGNLTSKIKETGAVDTATVGLYTLTYSVTDAAGNTGSASRVVTVAAATSTPSTTTAPATATTTPATTTSSTSTSSASSAPTASTPATASSTPTTSPTPTTSTATPTTSTASSTPAT